MDTASIRNTASIQFQFGFNTASIQRHYGGLLIQSSVYFPALALACFFATVWGYPALIMVFLLVLKIEEEKNFICSDYLRGYIMISKKYIYRISS